MNSIKKISVILVLISILSINQTIAQSTVLFKPRFQSSLKGDMTIIANNSVNRVDYNNTTNMPYYNLSNYSQSNQDFDMQYIDVDEDETTFSSSSAELFLDNPENKKVVYAGLYWSATYKYNEGVLKKGDKYTASDPARTSFSNIKLKLPNKEVYIDVSGQIIFDGINDKEYKEIAPYAVYADITSQVQELSSPIGVYTVANIKATQGVLFGGVSGGWTIFMVYEDATMSEKYITSYDGFTGVSGVTKNTTDVVFNGFQTPTTGNVKAKIVCAAIEGDATFIGDKILFCANSANNFIALTNNIRKENNFFNSTITIEDKQFLNRFPDSKNTLGYDTCLFTLPNKNNSLIENNVNQATLRISSEGDNYFMFFTAFNVELNPVINKENKEIASKVNEFKNPENDTVVKVKYVPVNNDFLINEYKTTSANNLNNKNKDEIEIQTMRTANQSKGYYLIANVLKSDEETKVYVAVLRSKKLDAAFFVNNLKYVYLKKTVNRKEALELYLSKMNDTYKEKLWIFSINNDNRLITNED